MHVTPLLQLLIRRDLHRFGYWKNQMILSARDSRIGFSIVGYLGHEIILERVTFRCLLFVFAGDQWEYELPTSSSIFCLLIPAFCGTHLPSLQAHHFKPKVCINVSTSPRPFSFVPLKSSHCRFSSTSNKFHCHSNYHRNENLDLRRPTGLGSIIYGSIPQPIRTIRTRRALPK